MQYEKPQVMYLGRAFSLTRMFADDSIPLNVSPDRIFTYYVNFDVYWPIASEVSLMLCCPNSLYTGIDPEMEKY